MTEDEAKTKWCPMVRTGLVAGMAVNHHVGSRLDAPPQGDVHNETRCVASMCMMWRVIPVVNLPPNASGYCGLAGGPTTPSTPMTTKEIDQVLKLHKAQAAKHA